ncbi:MAG: protein translocase subunit SecF [Oscillospiraceae bacterium]|nr:protein translocase subunit SecF [Oscillospiraceae bacterium]
MAKKDYDFVAKKNFFLIVPCVILVSALAVFAFFGLEIAIEFKGGTLMTYTYSGELELQEVEAFVGTFEQSGVRVSRGTDIRGGVETFVVSFATSDGISTEVQDEITAQLTARFPENDIVKLSGQNVSPSTGGSFFLKCLVAVLFSFVLLLLYIGVRFKKIGGLSAGAFTIFALLVDVMVVFSTFIFFRLPIDANFMAVVLTILAYSINNTIVIYDRIRENRTIYGKKLNFKALANKSINQSLTRAINTTLTTVMALIVICVVAVLMGVPSIITFAFPMLMGLISGVFTTLCLTATLWACWKERKTA